MARPGRIRVIVNGKIGGGFAFTKGGALAIVGRSWGTMSKALMRTHLTASASFARRNGGSLLFAAIPDDADVDTSGLDFKAANREALFRWAMTTPRPARPGGNRKSRSSRRRSITPNRA
jgi:hypothetical protein